MQVIVQVSAEVAHALHERCSPSAPARELLKIFETFGLTLEPMHAHTHDPKLRSYFTVEVVDDITAQRVIDRIGKLAAVKAGYVKPPDEMP